MTTARRPGTIPPKAKQFMLLTAACVTVLVNALFFVSANADRWAYRPSTTPVDGPAAVTRYASEGARSRVPVRPQARTISLALEPSNTPADSRPPRDADSADRWAPASAWRRERMRPEAGTSEP